MDTQTTLILLGWGVDREMTEAAEKEGSRYFECSLTTLVIIKRYTYLKFFYNAIVTSL